MTNIKVAPAHVIGTNSIAAKVTLLDIFVHSAWKDLHNFGCSFGGGCSSSASGYKEGSEGNGEKLHGYNNWGVVF